MKIAFDHQIFTAQIYGGISRYFTILAEELIKGNNDVKVFTGIHQNSYIKELPGSHVFGMGLKSYPKKTSRLFNNLNSFVSEMGVNLWKPQIIHETYYSSIPGGSIPRVLTVYDMIHELFPEYFPLDFETTENKKKSFARVNHIISISESTKKDLINIFDVDEKKITVVPLGVDLDKFKKIIFEIEEEKSFLLYVGSRGGYKNFFGFINAFVASKRLKNNFNIIAFGGGKFSDEEKKYFYEIGLKEQQVRQISGDDEVLNRLYQTAAAFIYPSLYEGFGLPPLEAMAAGCPVVCSNTSSMPEVVRDAGEYFDPKSIEEIVFSIENVIFSNNLRKKLIESGYRNAQKFSWNNCSSKTIDVYRNILGEK